MADIIGKKFGYLTVIKQEGTDGYYHKTYKCECECGRITYATHNRLKRGTPSCGCMRYKTVAKKETTHGMSKTRIYIIWQNMKDRCYRTKNKNYELYGGKGISVCEEWKNDFLSFYEWAIKNGYDEKLTIDRIDSNGNYEPNNCRWATRKQQCNNISRNRILCYKGQSKTMSEWADETGIPYTTIRARLNILNWDVERALTEGVLKHG